MPFVIKHGGDSILGGRLGGLDYTPGGFYDAEMYKNLGDQMFKTLTGLGQNIHEVGMYQMRERLLRERQEALIKQKSMEQAALNIGTSLEAINQEAAATNDNPEALLGRKVQIHQLSTQAGQLSDTKDPQLSDVHRRKIGQIQQLLESINDNPELGDSDKQFLHGQLIKRYERAIDAWRLVPKKQEPVTIERLYEMGMARDILGSDGKTSIGREWLDERGRLNVKIWGMPKDDAPSPGEEYDDAVAAVVERKTRAGNKAPTASPEEIIDEVHRRRAVIAAIKSGEIPPPSPSPSGGVSPDQAERAMSMQAMGLGGEGPQSTDKYRIWEMVRAAQEAGQGGQPSTPPTPMQPNLMDGANLAQSVITQFMQDPDSVPVKDAKAAAEEVARVLLEEIGGRAPTDEQRRILQVLKKIRDM